MLLLFSIMCALMINSTGICSNANVKQNQEDFASQRIGVAAQTIDSASTLSAYLAVIKPIQAKPIEAIATSLAPTLQGKPSRVFTANDAFKLCEELRKWALQNRVLKDAHLTENPDIHWAQLLDNSLYRYSGGRFTFDRMPIIQRQLKYIADGADFRFVRNEDGLIEAIRRLNPNEIANRRAKAYRAQCEADRLQKENAELQKELAQLEGTY